MGIRTLIKQLAGTEDLFLGNRTVAQTRNGSDYTITGLSANTLPYDAWDGQTIKEAIDAVTGITGSYNFETLAANKVILNGDPANQRLNPNGAVRNIELTNDVSTQANYTFKITNTTTTDLTSSLDVYNGVGGALVSRIYPGGTRKFRYDGVDWSDITVDDHIIGDTARGGSTSTVFGKGAVGVLESVAIGELAETQVQESTALGYNALSERRGTAVGHASIGRSNCVAIGRDATTIADDVSIGESAYCGGLGGVAIGRQATTQGQYSVALGYSSFAENDNCAAIGSLSNADLESTALGGSSRSLNYSVSVGFGADTAANLNAVALGYQSGAGADLSIALGTRSVTSRIGECNINIDGTADADFLRGSFGWKGILTTTAPTEIFLSGVNGARVTLSAQNSTVLAFTIYAVGRDVIANTCCAYQFRGVIAYDGAGTARIVGTVAKDILGKDDTNFDCNVTADSVNSALVLTVTGATTNITRWAAQGHYVEVHE